VTFPRSLLSLVCVAPLAACATSFPTRPLVDLSAARDEIAAARRAGAERAAPEPLSRAEAHLEEAESLAASKGKGAAERARRAEELVRLSITEAEWAASVASSRGAPVAVVTPPCEGGVANGPDVDARLRRAREEQQRLEERAALLMKELELTETEVERTKAKVRGQTKAEASSAIAEARILLHRMADEKVRSPNLARSQELVARAEELLREGNVAGAVFFAMTAQDLVEQARKMAADPGGLEHPAPKRVYFASGKVNVRKGPALTEVVIGQIPKGSSVQARSQRGEWLLVSYGSFDGWVYGPLLR
jgi:Bacterial SH3 domain